MMLQFFLTHLPVWPFQEKNMFKYLRCLFSQFVENHPCQFYSTGRKICQHLRRKCQIDTSEEEWSGLTGGKGWQASSKNVQHLSQVIISKWGHSQNKNKEDWVGNWVKAQFWRRRQGGDITVYWSNLTQEVGKG